MFYGSGNQISALRGVIVILVGIGLILGLALIGSDLVNPLEGLSQYEHNRVENRRLAQQTEVDMQQYTILQEAQTQAELERIAAETAYLQQMHQEELERARLAHEQELQIAGEQEALKLRVFQLAGYTILIVGGLSLLAFGIGGAVFIARLQPAQDAVRTRARAQANEGIGVWTPERRHQAREAARQREREERARALQEMENQSYELFQGAVQPERSRPQAELLEDLISLIT